MYGIEILPEIQLSKVSLQLNMRASSLHNSIYMNILKLCRHYKKSNNNIILSSEMDWSCQSEGCKGLDIRRLRNKCDIVEEPNSSSNYGIRVIFSP